MVIPVVPVGVVMEEGALQQKLQVPVKEVLQMDGAQPVAAEGHHAEAY
jgi:hypothetical protein